MANLTMFENKEIRRAWNEKEEDWYFSLIDIIEVLTESPNPRRYWSDLKRKLTNEGSELYEKIVQLKLPAEDGKMRITDTLNTKGVLRLIQSIPSPKAEPFKIWLAKVGAERLDEIADPEKAIQRGAEYYRLKGYPPEWINQRMLGVKTRKNLTDEWKERGISTDKEFAILTSEMTKAWSGLSVKEYKELKGLKKENLRDNMTDIELVLNMLAEITTTALSKQEKPQTFNKSKDVAIRGGKVAGNAKKEYEKALGQKVVTPLNATNKNLLEIKKRK